MTRIATAGLLSSLLVLAAACDSGGGSSSESTSSAGDAVDNGDPPARFTATSQAIDEGESTRLSWSSPEATSVELAPDVGAVENEGELLVSPVETTRYVLTARRGSEVNVLPLTVTVRPFAAVELVASVVEGDAPLSVRFTPRLESSTAINRVYWDFEGDGGEVDGGLGAGAAGFDRLPGLGDYDVAGRDLVHTFERPGTYETRVRVRDVDGNQDESSVVVVVGNAPPTASVRVTPTRGTVPLNARFVVDASDNEGVASYEWDFDGDGTYDETGSSRATNHRYESRGEFRPRVRLTDELGLSTELDPPHLRVDAVTEEVPTVIVTASTTRGAAPLEVDLRAGVSGGSSIVSWQWDLDGNGDVDSEQPNELSHLYEVAGTFHPTLTVVDEDGAIGGDVFEIVVEPDHGLTIENATLDPERDESASIELALNGESETELVIQSAAGTTVRTLLARRTRPSGEYSVSWDGADDDGAILAPGDYYAVLRYRVGDEERTLDARATSGGDIFYPGDWNGGCRFTETPECGTLSVSDNPIEPYADRPVVYAFTTPYNARVTAYITVIGNEDFAPATFFRGRVLPAGEYAIEWFGTGTDGRLLPRRDVQGYLPAIYGLTASDNAIFLSHGTRLDGLRAQPPIFYPASGFGPDGDTGQSSVLTFDLDRDADVLMTIDDANAGVEVFRREFRDVRAGSDVALGWDGRNANGDLVAPGGYRISLTATDRHGQRTLPARAMQRVAY